MNILAETSGYQANNGVLLRTLGNVKTVMEFLYSLYLHHYNPPLNTSPPQKQTVDFNVEIEVFAYFTTSLLFRKPTVQPQKVA